MWKTVKEYFSEFAILKNTPREFWIMNLVINFFEMLAYFSFITVLTLFLTDNIGLDDQTAGTVMAGFTLLLTIIIFFSGTIIDSIGVKKALFISMAMLIPCRLGLGLMDRVEDQYMMSHLDVNQAQQVLVEKRIHETAFSKDKLRFQQAQIDLVTGDPSFSAKGISADDLKKDALLLRENLLVLAKANPAVQQRWGESLEEKVKDQEELSALVVSMVAEKPELKGKYFLDFGKLSANQDELKKTLVSTVKLYPDLREKFSMQTVLWAAVIIILLFTAVGEALMSPAIYTALRFYTNKKTSGMGFNFQYLTMNIGAVLSFAMFDWLRGSFGNSAIMLVGSVFALICTIGVLFLRPNIEVLDDDNCTVVEHPEKKKEERENPLQIAISVFKEKAFWRFMLFLILLLGVRLNFTHQFLVMPKYYDRVLGDYSAIGALNTINPIIITIGLILMMPLLSRFKVFSLIVLGTALSAISVFALTVPGTVWVPFGFSIEIGYLIMILTQIVIFSVGELIWSPRLSEYTVTIAPKGREGSYMGLAALPMFIAKPLNSWLSGVLLTNFCPKNIMDDIVSGARSYFEGPEMMWLILGVLSITSPILVVLLRNVIKPKERNDGSASETPVEAKSES